MKFGVLCTFDLKSASSVDYENAYADLKALGLGTRSLCTSILYCVWLSPAATIKRLDTVREQCGSGEKNGAYTSAGNF